MDVVAAVGREEADAVGAPAGEEQGEQLAGRLVGPVDVLDDDEHRSAAAEVGEGAVDRLDEVGAHGIPAGTAGEPRHERDEPGVGGDEVVDEVALPGVEPGDHLDEGQVGQARADLADAVADEHAPVGGPGRRAGRRGRSCRCRRRRRAGRPRRRRRPSRGRRRRGRAPRGDRRGRCGNGAARPRSWHPPAAPVTGGAGAGTAPARLARATGRARSRPAGGRTRQRVRAEAAAGRPWRCRAMVVGVSWSVDAGQLEAAVDLGLERTAGLRRGSRWLLRRCRWACPAGTSQSRRLRGAPHRAGAVSLAAGHRV